MYVAVGVGWLLLPLRLPLLMVVVAVGCCGGPGVVVALYGLLLCVAAVVYVVGGYDGVVDYVVVAVR